MVSLHIHFFMFLFSFSLSEGFPVVPAITYAMARWYFFNDK